MFWFVFVFFVMPFSFLSLVLLLGSPPLSAVASVHIQIIDSSSPMFEQSSYEASIPENSSPYTPIITLQATSPYGQKLIYSISRGDKYGEFALDFNTGRLFPLP